MQRLILLALILVSTEALCQSHRVVHSHEIASEHLGEDRFINVSLPADYSSGDDAYPTLYVLDGEWIFDFASGTVALLSNDSLGHIPDMLVVGIPNTDRARDLTVTLDTNDGYESFLKFIEQEVVPFIDREYRTSGFNLFYGWSSGSAICGQLMVRRPMLFDAFLQSGAGIGPKSSIFLAERLPDNSYENKFLYVNSEGGGPRADALRRYSALIESIKPSGLRWKFEILEESTHLEVLPEGLQAGLSFVFADFRVPATVAGSGAKSVISYLEKVQSHFNSDVPIPQGAFVETASAMLHSGSPDEAIALLRHGVELYSDSAALTGALGEVYAFQEEYGLAAEAFSLAMRRAENNRALYLQNEVMHKKMRSLMAQGKHH